MCLYASRCGNRFRDVDCFFSDSVALFIISLSASLSCRLVTIDDQLFGHNPYHVFESQVRYDRKYRFSEDQRTECLRMSRHMFQFGYDSYMKYAFPKYELNPIDCNGREPDVDNPSNINFNDVLQDYSLTL